jgi:hypothetical protein
VSDAPESPKSRGAGDIDHKVERIKTYIQRFSYIPRNLEKRLDKHELENLATIRSRLQKLRRDIETLIKDYRARTGNT